MMHILLIHQFFLAENQGGGSRFNELTKFWTQKGAKITVVSGMVHYNTGLKEAAYKGKKFVKETNEHGVTVLRCHVSESYNSNFAGRLWGYFSFVFFGTWGALFKAKEKYDMVLVTSPPLFVGLMALIISKFKKIPFVFEIRDLWPESAIDTGVLTNKTFIKLSFSLENKIYTNAKLINCLTPAFERKLIDEKNVPASKVVMIPNAADFSIAEQLKGNFDAQSFRNEMGWNGKTVVLYVGAHGVANHLEQMVETAHLMKDTKAHFVLVGSGMQKKMLIEMAEKLNLNNIQFIDPVPKQEIFKYILACDLGASVLKKVDTFKTVYSNKTFDYMSCKKPILMAIDGVSRKLVEDAACGVYVEPEDPTDFANKIMMYIEQPALATQQGENGYHYAKKHFDREVLASKYLEILNTVMK